MSNITIAEFLGWEEGAIYRYKGSFYKIKNDMLLGSFTGEQDEWCADWFICVNDIPFLKEATKVEPKKYYLRHKFLESKGIDYLNQLSSGILNLMDKEGSGKSKTQFTEEEIEKIEATGFDLRNFERVEVEDD